MGSPWIGNESWVRTLRARDEEASHAEPNDEALGGPDGAEVAVGIHVVWMCYAEHEHAEGDEESARSEHGTEVAGIE